MDIGFLAFSFSRNDRRRASRFALLSGALLFYSIGYLLEILATTPGEAMMALRVENIGIPLIAPFFLLTALACFQSRLLRPWMAFASVLYGAAMFLMVFFNDYHFLYYSSIHMTFNGSYYVTVLGKGPLYFVQQFVTLSCMALSYATLVERFIRGTIQLRNQMKLFIIGSFFGFAANIANVVGIIPMGIDPTPFALSIGLVFFAVDLHRHKLMDIVPAAFEMTVETMDDAIIVLDADWGFIHCNRKAETLFPKLTTFSGMERITRMQGWPAEINPQSDSIVNFSIADPTTGQETLQRSISFPICDKQGHPIGLSLIIRDITEVTHMLNQMEALAITDPLTGAFNRRYFMTQVDRQINIAKRHKMSIGILLLDIDFFKKVNDTYGHLAGDKVLQSVVELLKKQLRSDDVLARYGGEEFIIMSNEKSEEGLFAFAERLRKAIEKEPIAFEKLLIPITVSFGAVMFLPDQSCESAIEAADKALYEAKNNGRNQVVLGRCSAGSAQK